MKTKQERAKKNKIIAVGFLITGVLMAIFLIVQKAVIKSSVKDVQEAGSYMIDFEGNIEYQIHDDDAPYVGQSYREAEIKLPGDYYKFLSTKETSYASIIHYMMNDKLKDGAYYLNCKKVDEDRYILYNGETRYYGLVDSKGNWIIKPECGHINTDYYEQYGFLKINRKDSWSDAFVDKDGNWILEPKRFYSSIYIKNGGDIIYYSYSTSEGEFCGACDLEGNTLYELSGEEVKGVKYTENFLIETTDQKMRLVDRDGNDIIKGDCKDISVAFYGETGNKEVVYMVCDMNDKYYLCDKDGKEITPHVYDELRSFTKDDTGIILAEKDGKKGIIDVTGKEELSIEYSDVLYIAPDRNENVPTSQRAFLVEKAGQIGLFTLEDGFLIELQDKIAEDGRYYYSYENKILYFYEGKLMHVVLSQNKEPLQIESNELFVGAKGVLVTGDYVGEERNYVYTLLDLDGNIIYSEESEGVDVTYIDDKLRFVFTKPEAQGGGYKFVYDGKETFECSAEKIKVDESFNCEMYAVCDDNGKYGLINNKGEVILDYQYEDIEVVHKDYDHDLYIIVKDSDEKYGVLDEKLQWIYEPQFDYAAEKYDGLEVTLHENQEIVK